MASRFGQLSDTASPATVPAGSVVTRIRLHSSAGGTCVITPAGGSALPTLVLPASAAWFELDFDSALSELIDGTTFAFTGTDAYVITYQTVGGSF
jgi:hypothetical protein